MISERFLCRGTASGTKPQLRWTQVWIHRLWCPRLRSIKTNLENTSSHSHHTPVGAIVGGKSAYPVSATSTVFRYILHLFLIGVIGGLAALAVAIALFVVFRRRSRREAAKKPPSTLYGPEGASPYRPGDTTAQPTVAPSFTPDHSMHQRLYVSLRSSVFLCV